MGQYQQSQYLGATAEDCYKVLPDVLRKLGVTIKTKDDGERKIRGYWGAKATGIFTMEVVCTPSDWTNTQITLFYDLKWTSVWTRPTRAIGVEKPPEVETMFNNIFLEVGRTIGAADAQPDDGNVPTAVASVPSPVLPDLKKELRGWGIGMIGIGVLSIIISEYLDPIWGGALIVIGILNLVIVHRAMFIVNGIILILAGVMNIFSLSSSGFSYFFIFGFLQIWWGIQEIVKFRKYKLMNKSSDGGNM